MPEQRHVGLRLTLDSDETGQLDVLAKQLTETGSAGPANDGMFGPAATIAQGLPLRLRRALVGMRHRQDSSYAYIDGLDMDDDAIGTTPDRWGDSAAGERTRMYDARLALLCSLLGDMFGWQTEQDGAIVHDILPMSDFADAQINFASTAPIWWHTEDAFHVFRPDYVALMCLRNPQGAATTVSCVDDWELDRSDFDALFTSAFRQYPDESHLATQGDAQLRPILLGSRRAPFVCVDPYYLERPSDRETARVLEKFYSVVESAMQEITLRPGDILIVDNYRAVHGRKPFRANYDGRDRWLKRTSVSRDLRHCWPAWTRESRHVLVGDSSVDSNRTGGAASCSAI
jgi:hypothetical protein